MTRRHTRYKPGDVVILLTDRYSSRPEPQAEQVHPATKGDDYAYQVRERCVVQQALGDGTLLLETKAGQPVVCPADSPDLRPVHWWQRLFHSRASAG